MSCLAVAADRRRIFWTTQPDPCGTDRDCSGDQCGRPGLQLVAGNGGRSFANNDFVRGLILNILLTDGRREDTLCGYRPGSRGGHWSDSFREDGARAGSTLRLTDTTGLSYRDAAALLQTIAESDLQKLVTMGVATQVKVTVSYRGRGVLFMEVQVIGQSGDVTRVGVTGTQMRNAWVWN